MSENRSAPLAIMLVSRLFMQDEINLTAWYWYFSCNIDILLFSAQKPKKSSKMYLYRIEAKLYQITNSSVDAKYIT